MGLGLGLGLDKPKGLIYFQNQFSMEFDGASDRIITDDADTVLQNTTYSFWCKSSETGQNRGVFGHGALNQGAFHFNWSSTRPLLYLGTGYYVHWNYTIKQGDGKWHHWVVYSDPNNLYNCKLYCDGVLQTVSIVVATSGASANAYTESLTIGADGQGPSNNHFLGSMDEFAVFDRELTQAEITRMYNTYYTNNLVKNGNFEEIGEDVVQNGSFEQIGGEEVTNGDFSQIGNEEVTNGDFSQIGSEEVTNGDFEQLGGDLVTNGDFSSGGAGWQSSNTTFANGIATIAYAGSGKLSAASNLNYTNGETYKVSLTLKGSGGVVNINADASSIVTTGGLDHNVTLNGETQNIEVYFQADANANNIVVQGVGAASYTFDVDNIVIKQTGIGWVKGTGWTISNGVASNDGTVGSNNLSQSGILVVGKQYKIDITVSNYVSGSVEVSAGASPRGTMTANGTYTFYQTCTPSATFYIIAQSFDGSIDNVSVQEVGQDWELFGVAAIDGNAIDLIDDGSNTYSGVRQDVASFVGKQYKIKITVTNWVQGSVLAVFGSNNTDFNVTGDGDYTAYLSPSSTGNDIEISRDFSTGANFSYSISNVSVKEVGQDWILGGSGSNIPTIGTNNVAINSVDGNSYIQQSGILTSGKHYKITYDVISASATSNVLKLASSFGMGSIPTSVGTQIVYGTAVTSNLYIERYTNGVNATITNISVKEVGQNWEVANSDADNYVVFNGSTARLKFLNTSPITSLIAQGFTLTSGKTYKLIVDIASVTSGSIKIDAVGMLEVFDTAGVTTRTLQPTGNSSLNFYRATADVDITLNSVVVQEVGQNWTFGNVGGNNGWRITDTNAICDTNAAIANRNITSNFSLVSGKDYKLTIDILQSADNMQVLVGSTTLSATLPTGTNLAYEYTISGADHTGGVLAFYAGTSDLQEIDNIVLQQLKHQATNLLVNSGDYQSANPLLTSTKSMNFDGIDDFLKVEDSANLRGMAALTVCCWVKFDTKNDYAKVLDYSSTSGNSQRKYRIQLNSDIDQKIQFLIANTSDTASTITSTDAIPTDRWVHLVGTFDNSLSANRQSFYIDGVLQNTATAFTETINNDDSGFLSFGENTYGSNNFDGQITEAGVYDRALTLLEVASLYNQGVPTNLLVNRNNYQSGNPTVFNTKQVDFDGVDDYLEIGDVGSVKSMSFWFNPDNDITAATTKEQLFGFNGSSYNGIRLGAATGLITGETLTVIEDGGSFGRTATTKEFDAGRWYHIVISWNETASYFDIYVDGVLSTDLVNNTFTLSNWTNFKIGVGNNLADEFNGKISQTGVFNSTLTADEVSSLYNHGLPIDLTTNQAAYASSSNLVGYWRMGSGTNDGFPIIQDQLSPSLAHISTTNLFTYSEDFGQSFYIKDSGVSVGTTNNVSPSGESNATKIDVTDNGRIYANVTSGTYVSSVFIKAGTFAYFKIVGVNIDLVAGTSANGTIESLGSGWFRVGVNYTGNRPFQIQAYPDGTYSSHTTSGNYFIWGAQLEEHPVATPYVKSNGIPGQRKSSTTNLFPYSEDN
jgi:hypothetical protein